MRQRGADHALMRGQHHRERTVPDVLIGIVVERAEARHTGIVHENVDAAEIFGNLRHYAHDRILVCHIECIGFRPIAAFGGEHGAGCGIDIRHRNVRAFGREKPGGCAPHAAGGTGDDGNTPGDGPRAVGQFVHGSLPCRERA